MLLVRNHTLIMYPTMHFYFLFLVVRRRFGGGSTMSEEEESLSELSSEHK
jgi:hypothetical protein